MSSTRKESILGKRRDDCRPTQGGGWPAGILAIAALAAGSRAQSTAPDWSWFVLAQGIGNGQLTVSANAGVQELIVPCGASGFTSGSRYWMILRHDVGANNYQQRFVSPLYPVSNPIVKMLAGDLLATPGQEIVVALRNGDVEVWSQASRQRQVSFSNNLTNTQGACLGDVDGDGDLDIIVVSPGGVRARDNAGQLLLLRDDLHGSDVAAGQFDGDPALEIACSDGQVFDCGTQSVQATWQNGFAGDLDSADIDGDGMLELVQADPVGFVWAHDVDVMIPKFS